MTKKMKKNDAIMTGILVTRFKMGLINVEDLEQMAEDMSGSERSSAAKKVLERIRDLRTLPRRSESLQIPDHSLQIR
jgi:hypothetical protein